MLHIDDQKPDPKDLEKILTKHCKHWRSIGIRLGLEDTLLDNVESDNSKNQRECFRITLKHWQELNVGVTWESLEFAITNANRVNLDIEPLEKSKYLKII